MSKEKEEEIKEVCEIYKTMTYDGHKPRGGLEKARCMAAAFRELLENKRNENKGGKYETL